MAHLRATRTYRTVVIQDLRPLWKAVTVTVDPLTPIATLEKTQRAPQDAERQHTLQEGWDVEPSAEIGAYLDTRDARLAAVLSLPAGRLAPRWMRQDVHSDTAELEPCSWWERIDAERMAPATPTPAVELRVTFDTTGARVMRVDTRSGEAAVLHELSPAGPAHAFHDFASLQKVITATVRDIETTFTRYYEQANWLKNAPSESRLLHDDLPALVQWFVAGKRPPDDATRRRLSALSREMLDLTPPRKTQRKNSPKLANFFARLSEKRGYSEDEE
jgi:hypothetical protein